MQVELNETILVLTAESLNEAAIVGMIRQALQEAKDDLQFTTSFGVPGFDTTPDSAYDDSTLSEIHIALECKKAEKAKGA